MKTIAVIEDNADNRLLVKAILSQDYQILEFEDGPAALAGLDKNLVDLILLDISLPGMDGIEVLEKMRALDSLKSTPAIALTAHAMSGDREKFLAAGFDAYYSKPIVDIQDFKATVAAHLT